jgi:hypothetical protein
MTAVAEIEQTEPTERVAEVAEVATAAQLPERMHVEDRKLPLMFEPEPVAQRARFFIGAVFAEHEPRRIFNDPQSLAGPVQVRIYKTVIPVVGHVISRTA